RCGYSFPASLASPNTRCQHRQDDTGSESPYGLVRRSTPGASSDEAFRRPPARGPHRRGPDPGTARLRGRGHQVVRVGLGERPRDPELPDVAGLAPRARPLTGRTGLRPGYRRSEHGWRGAPALPRARGLSGRPRRERARPAAALPQPAAATQGGAARPAAARGRRGPAGTQAAPEARLSAQPAVAGTSPASASPRDTTLAIIRSPVTLIVVRHMSSSRSTPRIRPMPSGGTPIMPQI